ncbi:hypothetical protein Tco_0194188 [Tanacetum coccineum]
MVKFETIKYAEITEQEKLQDDCDVQAINIVLQGLSPDVYALVDHCKSAKDIWERVKLLMKGTKLSYQERECKLYNEFDKFTSVKGLVVPSILPGDDLISCLNKAMAFMSTVMASHFPSTNNQLKTSSNPRNQATIQDGRVTVQQDKQRLLNVIIFRVKGIWQGSALSLRGQVLDEKQLAFLADPKIADSQDTQPTIIHNVVFQTNDQDAYDFDCDDISSAKAVLMANLSSYGSKVLSEVPQYDTYQNDNMLNHSVQETQYFEQSRIDYVPDNEITSDSNIISYEQYLQETQNAIVQDTNSSTQQDAMIMSVFEQISEQMSNYFSNPISEQPVVQSIPVRTEAPSEIPKVSMVKTSFQKLKNHLANFDKVMKVKTTPDAITEGSWGFEHTKAVFKQEVIPFIKTLWDLFKDFNNGLHSKINEVKRVFNQMETAIEQYVMNIVMHADFVTVNVLPANNKYIVHDNLEIERLEQENDHLFELLLSQDIVHICVNSLATHNKTLNNQNAPAILEFFKIKEWQVDDAKDISIANLRKHIKNLKGKNVIEMNATPKNAKIIAPGMFKLDLEPLTPKVLNNRDAHIDYIKHSREHADTLREIVEHARALRHLDSDLDSASKRSKLGNLLKVFTDIGYRWKPTRRTFTIVGNSCPLTRFTSTKIEPLKETTLKSVTTTNPEIKIYRRKTKVAKLVDLRSEPSILGSRPSNISKPNKHWGSTVSNFPSSSLVNFRLSRLFSDIWTLDAPII